MYSRRSPKLAVALAATLLLSMAPVPVVALVDYALGTPDQYQIDLEVVEIQALLAAKGFYRGPVDGVVRDIMADAILTFHKAADLERTTTFLPEELAVLAAWEPYVPDLPDQPNRLEVDIERQVMHLVIEGAVTSIFPISSGNGELYRSYRPGGRWTRATTPRGSYEFYHHIPRWRIAPLGGLYKPWYFLGGFAIHGSRSVPAYPASHGCVRVTMDDADWLAERLSLGFAIILRDTIPPAPISVSVPSFTDPLGMYSSPNDGDRQA